jgi:antitoxin ParD1/3/4
MSQVEKVSIALSSELLRAVKDAVASGQYGSASEVVREALREWKLRQPLRLAEIERLRTAWQEGIDSGPSKPLDFEEIKRKGRERLIALKAQQNAR